MTTLFRPAPESSPSSMSLDTRVFLHGYDPGTVRIGLRQFMRNKPAGAR